MLIVVVPEGGGTQSGSKLRSLGSASNHRPDQDNEAWIMGDAAGGQIYLAGFWHIFDESELVDTIVGAKFPEGTAVPALWYINTSTGDAYELLVNSLRTFILDYGEFGGVLPREMVVSTGPAYGLAILNLTSSSEGVSARTYKNYESIDPKNGSDIRHRE